jgi:hypothetical protein
MVENMQTALDGGKGRAASSVETCNNSAHGGFEYTAIAAFRMQQI